MTDESQGLLLTRPEELEELVVLLRQEGRFAFDTEFVSEETFEPVLCLVQVAYRDRLALIDAPAVRDLSPFWDVVTDPAVAVVMHAAGEDLRICRLRAGRLPRRVFDVQIAAGLVGLGYPLSLGNLVNQALGVDLPGGETRTDWRRRPLSPAQVRYALDDVRFLLEIADRLQARLDQWGRSAWAEAEFADFLAQVESRGDEDRWRRLPGIHQLNRRGLEAARRLAEWRQEDARRSNRPLRQVLRDDLLVAIAKRQPAGRRDLEALRDFNRPALLSRAAEILAVLAEARGTPAERLPEPFERRDEGPGLSMVVSLLAASLAQCCAQQQVTPGLVGTSGDLKDLVRWHAEGRPEGRRPALVRGWRAEVCGRTLLDVLSGRRALRVVDPMADVPVALEPLEGSEATGTT
jgi:ribonuclease D